MKEDVTVRIDAQGNGATLTILHGEAVPQRESVPVIVKGDIDAPRQFFLTRHAIGYFKPNDTHVVVSLEERSIKLVAGEHSYYADKITGVLTLSKDMQTLGINAGKLYTAKELADTLRKMPYLFSDKAEYRVLLEKLNKLNARISARLQQEQDTRGNKTQSREVIVDTDLPNTIALKLQLFTGQAVVNVAVEVFIETYGTDIRISLESAQLYEDMPALLEKIMVIHTECFTEAGITVMYT